MLRGIEVINGSLGPFVDEVTLDYENRHRRRLVLCGNAGTQFLLDLADAAELRDGDAILLSSGQMIHVRATEEPLMEIRSSDATQLARICWHIGNRHLAAEIGNGVLRLRADHVIAAMIEGLGGTVHYLAAPFHPERGAYDGRAMTPSRHDAYEHAHGHDHG